MCMNDTKIYIKNGIERFSSSLLFFLGDIGVIVVAENDLALKCLGKARTELAAKFLDLDPLDFR
jgi:hypothetical protein